MGVAVSRSAAGTVVWDTTERENDENQIHCPMVVGVVSTPEFGKLAGGTEASTCPDSAFCPFANIAVPPSVESIEDEHPLVSAPLRNHTTFFLNEALDVCKPDLDPLVDDLSDRHQVLRDCRNVVVKIFGHKRKLEGGQQINAVQRMHTMGGG